MTFRSVMNSIGNAFKTGWNNGNIAKGVKIAGAAAMTGAIVSAAIDDSKNGRSIFNMGGGCCGGGCYGGGVGVSPYLINNPMDILNTPMAQYTYGNSYGGYASNFGMLNSLNSFNNNNYLNPYSYPIMNMYQQPTPAAQDLTTNAEYAGDIDADQDTEAGAKLDENLNALTKNGEAVEGKSANLVDFSDSTDQTKLEAEYKTQISELAKSYIANIDKSGNSDKKVTIKEFVDAQLAKLPEDASEAEKEKAKQKAINAFGLLDQNGDGKFDWKEAAAMMRTFDRNSNNKVDGKIQSEDFARYSTALGSGATELKKMFISDYKHLFGDDK